MSELKPRIYTKERRIGNCHECPHLNTHIYKDGACTIDNQNWVRLPNLQNKPRIILESCPLPFTALQSQLSDLRAENEWLKGQLLERGQRLYDLGEAKCNCGSNNIKPTGDGISQDAAPDLNRPMVEGDQMACADCGNSWYE